jgi:hypothetical protein
MYDKKNMQHEQDELLALRDEGLAKLRENPDYKLQGAHHHHEPRPSVSRAGMDGGGNLNAAWLPGSALNGI